MKKLLKKLIGRWRLLFGFCPACNSDAPELYDCRVCNWYITSEMGMPTTETKKIWWEIFTKTLWLTTILICVSLSATAQKDTKTERKDSVVIVQLTREEYIQLLQTIDANIDSKKTISNIIEFINKHAALIPKEEKKK